MWSKEKAKHLYDIYLKTLPDAVEIDKETIINCCLIMVDEILEILYQDYTENMITIAYYHDVKKEIKNL